MLTNIDSKSPAIYSPGFATLLLAALLAAAPGCSLLRAPQRVANSVVSGKNSPAPDPLELQVQIERFADNFTLLTAAALDDYASQEGTESARVEALQLKLIAAAAMTAIASGPRPNASLLDLVCVTTLGRMALEYRWTKAANPTALAGRLATGRTLETNVWQLAASHLQPDNIKELHKTIDSFWEQNPGARDTSFFRTQELASLLVKQSNAETDRNSVFSLMNLDPTAGLDPAVREITQSRLAAERAMYLFQRMPFILRLQTELLTCQVAAQPAVQLALTNFTLLAAGADRLSRASESVSLTAAQLPDRISTERKELFAALDSQEGKLKDLSGQVDRALESGEKMSTSLNTTIGSFTTLMKLFGVGEPSTNATLDTNLPPFNILDYGQVADQVGSMAMDLGALINSANQAVPQLELLGQNASSQAQSVMDRGFRLCLVLIAVFLLGAVLAGLAFRFLAVKLKRPVNSVPPSAL